MQLFKVDHVACYICGKTGQDSDVKMLDWQPKNNGDGFGPYKTPLLQVALCKDCRKELSQTISER